MLNKKVLSLMIAGVVAITGCGISYAFRSTPEKKSSNNIKVLAYKESTTIVSKSNYKIDKFDGINAIAWLNDNEVLTIRYKSTKTVSLPYGKSALADETKMLSVYNLDTGETKDFKDANVFAYIGLSKDNKYALYKEARNIPPSGSDEYKKEFASGELFRESVKILNLQTGEITQLKHLDKNSDDTYIWLDGTKLLEVGGYTNQWQIVDVNGKIYKSGYLGKETDSPLKVSNEYGTVEDTDIKISGDNITGCIYFEPHPDVGFSQTIKKYDITTNELTTVVNENKNVEGIDFSKQNDMYLEDLYIPSKETFKILNKDFSTKKEIATNDYVFCDLDYRSMETPCISPDETKLYFLGRKNILQQLDLQTGTITEIFTDPITERKPDVSAKLFLNNDGSKLLYNNGANTTYVLSFK